MLCPPHVERLPLNCPLSLLKGATPTRAAISLRFRRPSSGNSAMITLDNTSPTPGTLVSRSSSALHTGLDSMNSRSDVRSFLTFGQPGDVLLDVGSKPESTRSAASSSWQSGE